MSFELFTKNGITLKIQTEYQAMKMVFQKEPITWAGFVRLQEILNIDLDHDCMYDKVGILHEIKKSLKKIELTSLQDGKTEILALNCLVGFVLPIPISKASCECIFSIMEQVWSKERNRFRE